MMMTVLVGGQNFPHVVTRAGRRVGHSANRSEDRATGGAEVSHIRGHASGDAIGVRNRRRTEPEGVGRAGLFLCLRHLERMRRQANSERCAQSQCERRCSRGATEDVQTFDLHDSPPFRGAAQVEVAPRLSL